MDWSSDDYSRVYADTFLTPAPETGTGIYLLDEAGRDTDPYDRDRLEAPIRRYGPKGPPRRPPAHSRREGYYTGGNIISDRGNTRAVFDVAWDERPLHYNPHSGSDWAHLVPPPSAHRGPPAFPLTTRSEGANNPGAVQLPGSPSKECFGGACGHPAACACGRSTELNLQYLKVFLLIVIVVLLAMTLMAAGRLARSLEKTVRSAVGVLGAVAVGGRPAQ